MIENIYSYIDAISRADTQNDLFWKWFRRRCKEFAKTRSTRGFTYRGKAKQCYYNAQKAAISNNKVTYYEGLAYSRGLIPVDHAWVVYRGVVIDPTWERWSKERLAVYLGVPIPTEYIAKHWAKYGTADNLLKIYYWERISKVKPEWAFRRYAREPRR